MGTENVKTVKIEELSGLLECKVGKRVGECNINPIVIRVIVVEEAVLRVESRSRISSQI